MLPHVRLRGVVARKLYVVKAVKRPVKSLPELKVLKRGIRLQRGIFFGRGKRLEMSFSYKRRFVPRRREILAQRVLRLLKLGSQRPCAVLRGIFARNP